MFARIAKYENEMVVNQYSNKLRLHSGALNTDEDILGIQVNMCSS
jgi:hypothetical protein